jgi:aminopeptidase
VSDRAARLAQHARILVDYSANVGLDETVAILGSTLATPLIEAIFERVLARGGYPTPFLSPPRLEEILLRHGSEAQLRRPPFFDEVCLDYFDHIIAIGAPENTRYAGSIEPRRLAVRAEARGTHSEKMLAKMMRPDHSITAAMHPTPALAQDAGMSLLDYEDFVYRACLLDEPDPAAAWRAMSERQARICDWLSSKSTLRIQGPDADLTLTIAGRRWYNADGHKNLPDGEVFTSPVEESAEGHVRFTYPATYQGSAVHDTQLWFEGGRVVRAESTSGTEYLQAILEADEGARRLGEVAIGTNDQVARFTGHALFDEKLGGSFHLALGRGFPDLGGRNVSSIHWDMVCDLRTDSTISADGEVFYRDGAFTLP